MKDSNGKYEVTQKKARKSKVSGYYIVLIVLIIAITVTYIAEKVADIFKAKYENTKEKSGEDENTKEIKEKQ